MERHFRLDEEIDEQLEELSKKSKVPKNRIINMVLGDYFRKGYFNIGVEIRGTK